MTEARFDEAAAEWSLTVRAADGTETTEVVDGDRLRGGTAQPPVLSRRSGTGAIHGPVLPLGRLGRHGGAGRAARCRHRERCQCGAVRPPPGGGGPPPRRLPAHRALVAPDGQLRQPVPVGVPRAAAVASRLRALGPAVAVLASARGAARGGPGRPRLGPAHRSGERRQRLHSVHAARRPAGPGRRRRPLREDGPALPALRQAGPARRRALGGGAEPLRRRPRDDAHRRDHAARRADRRRRGAPGGRGDLRHGLPRLGVRGTHEGLRRPGASSSARSGTATPRPISA